uniref:Uncharacterized protein n=1 Tax=Meloidogyne enterolobii TaxID=390850 RepID=A0A6V7WC73_MELEN|nr:unnamed protein product [Meloidogyne enterolobii]
MSGFERCSSSPLLIGAILLFNLAVADGNAVDNTDDDVKIMKVFFGWINPGEVGSNVRNFVLVIIGILALIACLCFLVYCFVCGGNDNKKDDAKSNEKSSKKSGTDLESGLVSDADSKTAEKSDIKSEADKSDKKDDKKEDNKKSDKKDDKKSEKEHTAKSKSSSSSSSDGKDGKKKKSKKGKKGKDDKKKDKKGEAARTARTARMVQTRKRTTFTALRSQRRPRKRIEYDDKLEILCSLRMLLLATVICSLL